MPTLPLELIDTRNDPGGNYTTLSFDSYQTTGTSTITLGDNYVNLSTAGSLKVTINSSGNVGIGTTSPETQLQIGDYTGTERILLSGANSKNVSSEVIFADNGSASFGIYKAGAGLRFNSASNVLSVRGFYDGQTTADFSFVDFYRNIATTATPIRFNYDTSFSGDVGIGTTSPSDTLEVEGGITITSETPTKLRLNNTKNGTWTAGESLGLVEFYGNDTSGGGAKVQSSIDVVAHDQYGAHFNMLFKLSKGSTSNLEVMKLTGEGDLYMTDGTVTATNFILSSDKRLKENIEKVCDDRVKVDWKTFELKTEKGEKRYGVIAQELEENHPEFVKTDDEGFKSVKYIDLLIAKIAELEARLEKAGI